MSEIREKVDVCVVGAGHAGCEAALACARLGLETVIFTVSVDSIALMPCNPNIGGSSKGHLVREVDALGGEMGKVIDQTFIQSKMLNRSKGPAVHSLRAQADKADYTRKMRQVIENQEHLIVKQAEVSELLSEVWENEQSVFDKKIVGVKISTGIIYECKAVILCTGTYLNARCLCGETITYTGPNGLQPARFLTDSEWGFTVFKMIIVGLPVFLHSSTVFSSPSTYCSLERSVKLPSVVTMIPILECSSMTFLVPSSAAFVKGISWADQGVLTIRSFPSSI